MLVSILREVSSGRWPCPEEVMGRDPELADELAPLLSALEDGRDSEWDPNRPVPLNQNQNQGLIAENPREAPPQSRAPEGTYDAMVEAMLQVIRPILEGLPIGVLLHDRRGRTRLINARARRYLGCGLSQLSTHRAWLERIAGHPIRLGPTAWDAKFSGGHSEWIDRLVRSADGAERRLQIHEQSIGLNSETGHRLLITTMTGTPLPLPQRGSDSNAGAPLSAMLNRRPGPGFLAYLSHEIRSTLTAILGRVDSLRHRIAEPELVRDLDAVNRHGMALNEILRDILDLARLESGQFQLQDRRIPLSELIDDVLDLMRPSAQAKRLVLGLVYETRVPTSIQGDAVRLRQVLVNLVSNAIKYTDIGAVRIHVRWISQSGSWLQFEVRDTGRGIPSRLLDRLFTPFTRQEEIAENGPEGSGLGLAICDHLVQLMGGMIRVTSGVGVGTNVIVRVPTGPLTDIRWIEPSRRDEPDPADQPAVDFSEPVDNPTSHRSEDRTRTDSADHPEPTRSGLDDGPVPTRILIVDDTQAIRAMVRRILAGCGYEVQDLGSGVEALNLVGRAQAGAERPIGLVLLDLFMPGWDGFAILGRLRRDGYDGPILAITADASPDLKARWLAAGGQGVIEKPFTQASLIAHVRPWLETVDRPA